MITYHTEAWSHFWPDATPLWEQEHRVETHPPEIVNGRVNVGTYAALDAFGLLDITTAREDMRLAGYVITMITEGLHWADILTGYMSFYFLTRRLRRQGIGGAMFRHAFATLERRGVQLVISAAKLSLGYAPTLHHLGFVDHEMCMLKWLGKE